MSRLPLHDAHAASGAVFAEVHGWTIPRHYGDPAGEYRAAVGTLGVADRSYRGRVRVTGRSPVEVIHGLVTNDVRRPATRLSDDVLAGRGAYAALLTPKGRMIADLRVFWWSPPETPELLLDIAAAGLAGAVEHFRRYMPPRLARSEDVTGTTGMLTVVGPRAAEVVSREVAALRVEAGELAALAEDAYRIVGGEPHGGVLIARTGDAGVAAFDVIAARETIGGLWEALVRAGALPIGYGVWETLRIEAGRPAYGVDMTEATIPVEAGLEERAIDYRKGCYTGQEVIVRIRDRGHVNWKLRGILLGEQAAPAPGTELFGPDAGRAVGAVGRITSAAQSPKFGQTIALAYLRREIAAPATLRLGAPSGPEAQVVELPFESGGSLAPAGQSPDWPRGEPGGSP
ncbi:MAG: aminomethyl transferase family protein [Gemmatimonadetes bacterium]|nr:aminomethyl transferase family protein [Gemmatimonadota bacterium]